MTLSTDTPRAPRLWGRTALAAVLLTGTAIGGFAIGQSGFAATEAQPGTPVNPPGSGMTGHTLPDFTDLVEKQGAAVVNISTTQAARGPLAGRGGGGGGPIPNLPEDDPFYEFFRRFMPNPQNPQNPQTPREFPSQSLGSGFIISADGYVLMNAHVVEAADEITVKLTDKRELKAKVIGSDRRTDIALLKIDPKRVEGGLRPLELAPGERRLRPGEATIAIGAPFGLAGSVTTHSVRHYKEPAIFVGVCVEIVFVSTPHPASICSRGYSKMH